MPGSRANLATLVDDFECNGKNLAIVAARGFRQRRVTYRELALLTRRFGAELANRQIVKGDRVLIWGDNGPEWVTAFFGCILRGVLPVPIDSASEPDFARRVEKDVSPKLVAGDANRRGAFANSVSYISFEDFEQLLPAQAARAIDDLNPANPLQIIFTSGTTGDPKGIVHTHKNVLASLEPIETEIKKYLKYERVFHPIRILHTLPLSHVFGQFMGLWIPPLFAAELHYESRLVASELFERIHNERISVLAAVPRVLELMQTYALGRFRELSSSNEQASQMKAWRRWWHFRQIHRALGFKFWAFVCGGASLSPQGEQFWRRLGFVVVQGYGMTETTALVSLNHPFRLAPGTVGKILPGRDVRLSNDGEVLVRGDTISNATWQHGQLHRQESEWLATGDIADFDEQGNLRFRGRKKDVIVTSSGLNIYPDDLEAALNRQPGVRASVVIETNTDHNPEPLAVLVLKGDADVSATVASANQELAEFQQIRRWRVWNEPDFPRTSTGKILRREVAQKIAANSGDSSKYIADDLNLDSLALVQLQAQLEQQYGISLEDSELRDVKTSHDIQQLIRTSPVAPQEPSDARQHRYPHWPWAPLMQFVRSLFLELIAMPLLRFLAKPAIKRGPRTWPTEPVLIICNHITSYDAAFVLYALPGHIRRRVAIAMSAEMLLDFRRARNQGNWFVNALAPIAYLLIIGLFNVFPLPQYSGFRRSFRHAGEAIDRGYSVLVFPEGRRSDDGMPQPFKSGSGLLWKDLGIAALPVRIDGLGKIKASHARWFRTGRISVSVGDVLLPDPDRTPEQLTEHLRRGVFG